MPGKPYKTSTVCTVKHLFTLISMRFLTGNWQSLIMLTGCLGPIWVLFAYPCHTSMPSMDMPQARPLQHRLWTQCIRVGSLPDRHTSYFAPPLFFHRIIKGELQGLDQIWICKYQFLLINKAWLFPYITCSHCSHLWTNAVIS